MIMNSQASHDRFATTRWSMVMRIAEQDTEQARDALGDLARRYAYPVYAFLRRSGQAPALAERTAHAMLQRLVLEDTGAQQPIASRQYRNHLLERISAYLADGDAMTSSPAERADSLVPANLERRYERDHAVPSTAEQAFQRSFAMVVIERTLRRLRDEAAQTGHADMCRALEPYLVRDPAALDYDRLALQLRSRKVTLIVALKRLRQRLQELATLELSDTVSSADDLAKEQDALLAILAETMS